MILRSPLLSRILLLALAGVLIWSAVVAGRAVFRYTQIQEDIAQERQALEDAQQETADLSAALETGDDIRALELEAKRRLNLKRPGEEVVIIIPGDEEQVIEEALKAQGAIEPEEAEGFFSRIKNWFQNSLQ